MSKSEKHNSISEAYYEQRYRDNLCRAERRSAYSKKEKEKVKKEQREYWNRNKDRLNRNRREAYFLMNKNEYDLIHGRRPKTDEF